MCANRGAFTLTGASRTARVGKAKEADKRVGSGMTLIGP